MTTWGYAIKRDARVVVFLFSAFVALALCASSASAQTSFGKMRGNGESPAPTEIDDEGATEEVDGAEKASSASSSAKKTSSSSSKGRPSVKMRSSSSRKTSESLANAKTADEEETAEAERKDSVESADSEDASAETTEDGDATVAETSESKEGEDVKEAKKTSKPSASRKKKGTKSDASEESASDGKRGPIRGKPESHKYRAGMIFAAAQNGACSDVVGTAPVPTEFFEQKVRTLEENFPRVAKVDYRELKEGGAKQLVFKMRELKAGQSVEATVLFEVTRYPLLPPTEPEIYRIPKNPPKECRRYLKNGPYIESNTKTLRSLAKDVLKGVEGDWNKVDAILKYVRDNIQYKEVLIEKPIRGAMAALKTKDGDCEDMSALFIAMCRASDIPARLTRVPGHCWAEFYLEDEEGEGYWFPAQVAGTEPLGSLQDCRVILQKGDNFKLPETPKEETLYVKELFMGNVKEGGDDPFHQFIQEVDGE